MALTWPQVTRYPDKYLFSFLHLLVFSIVGGVALYRPEWGLLLGQNKLKVMASIVATLPLSFCLDYLRYNAKLRWSLLLGVLVLFFVLSYLAFQNYRLPLLDLNYYNLLYIIVFYVFCLSILASAYFFTLSGADAWNNVVYFIYSYLYAILYAVVSCLGVLLILYLVSNGLEWGLSDAQYMVIGAYLFVIFFQLYFLYIKSDTESSPIEGYPTPLLIFVSYVLFPLFVLLTGTIAVIIGLMISHKELGQGWVGYILLAYWLLGLMLFFLIYPIRNVETKYPWMRRYPARFSILLIPLGILMVYDVLLRAYQLGYTEPRYIFLWFGILSVFLGIQYLIDRQNANLKRMGTALIVVLGILLYGGLNMSTYCNKSQNKKVIQTLESYQLISEGKMDTLAVAETQLHERDRASVSSTLDYLQSKQYSAYRSILPEFWGTIVDPYEYFDYAYNPWLMSLLSYETGGHFIQLRVQTSLSLTTVFQTQDYNHLVHLSSEEQFANVQLYGSQIKLKHIPLAGYQLDLDSTLYSITEMLNLAHPQLSDSFTYYIGDQRSMDMQLPAIREEDTLSTRLLLGDLDYSYYPDSFIIKKINAYLLY